MRTVSPMVFSAALYVLGTFYAPQRDATRSLFAFDAKTPGIAQIMAVHIHLYTIILALG